MSESYQIVYDYTCVPSVREFTQDNHFIKAIMGPVGSGKSSGCVMDLINRSFNQQPDGNGIRRTRWVVIRNTYRQLKDTTIKTFKEWAGAFVTWREAELTALIQVKQPDGTYVDSEFLFRALDNPEHIRNLLSLEVTGAWLNEARELPKEVFEAVQTRVGRFPRRTDGVEATWFGVILDTNPPDTDHWWFKIFEEIRPENCYIIKQPSGLSPEAENIKNLPPNYYKNAAEGKDDDFIRVYIHGEYGFLKEGRAVFANFKDNIHVAKGTIKPIRQLPLIIGMDLGLTPSAVITQMDIFGRLYIYDEVQAFNKDVRQFCGDDLKPLLRSPKYVGMEHLIIGDPAGNIRSQNDSRTAYQEIRAQGLKARAARTNRMNMRYQSVNTFMVRMVKGEAAFVLSPECNLLRKALNGGYHYRRMRVTGERYADVPEKNEYSHLADALQYACLEHEMGFSAHRSVQDRYTEQNVLPVSAWT